MGSVQSEHECQLPSPLLSVESVEQGFFECFSILEIGFGQACEPNVPANLNVLCCVCECIPVVQYCIHRKPTLPFRPHSLAGDLTLEYQPGC